MDIFRIGTAVLAMAGMGFIAHAGLVEHPAPTPVAISLPAAAPDAYLCAVSCANRPMDHDPTVEMAHHFGPDIGPIGSAPPMPAIVIGPLPQPKVAAVKAPKASKQVKATGGAKASKPKAQKAPKAAKAPKQPKAAKTTVPTVPTPVPILIPTVQP